MTDGTDPIALIVVDAQCGFEAPVWRGRRNNPSCEENIAALVTVWREGGWPVVFVRHDSRTPAAPLAPGQPGNDFKSILDGKPDLLVAKQVNSAFTDNLTSSVTRRGSFWTPPTRSIAGTSRGNG
ncbi:MAG: isochorismatase family protein [Solirubrobacteraceae bacterium]